MKYVQIHLIFQMIMNIYVWINLQKIIIILIMIKIYIKNVIILVKNVMKEVMKKNHNCTECKSGLGFLEDSLDNSNCYKVPIGYYLDIIDNIYKKCHYTCINCDIKGNNITHNCIQCDINYPMEFKINKYFNCYHNCSYYYILIIMIIISVLMIVIVLKNIHY